jgi:hypothetical protein
MYESNTRKQYAKLYKEALEKLASLFGLKLPDQPPAPPQGKAS